MAAITICSDFGAPNNKVWHCFHRFPIYWNSTNQKVWLYTVLVRIWGNRYSDTLLVRLVTGQSPSEAMWQYLNCKAQTLQFSSVTQLCLILCDPMNFSTPGFHVHHQLPEPSQTHAYWVGNTIQPSHPLSSLFPSALNLFQNQGLFQWVSSSHQVAKVLEFQLQ